MLHGLFADSARYADDTGLPKSVCYSKFACRNDINAIIFDSEQRDITSHAIFALIDFFLSVLPSLEPVHTVALGIV